MLEARGISRYQEADATSVGPEKLIVMVYEKLRDHLLRSIKASQNDDPHQASDSVNAAQLIIVELRNALDHSLHSEMSLNLQRLYDYMFQENLSFLLDRQDTHLTDVLHVLEPLLTAWRQIPPGAAEQARRDLTENPPVETAPGGPEPAQSPAEEHTEVAHSGSELPSSPASLPSSLPSEEASHQSLVSLTA